MNLETPINAIWTSLSLIGITYLVFWKIRMLAEDWFRDQVFQLRDDLFDRAADGLISFDSPAYGLLRMTMNGYIRFCHKLSLLQIIISILVSTNSENKNGIFRRNWEEVTKGLDNKTLKELEEYKKNMEILVIKYILFSSPVISTMLGVFVLFGYVITSTEQFRKKHTNNIVKNIQKSSIFNSMVTNVDDVAYATGGL